MKIEVRKSVSTRDFTGAMTDISFLLIIFFLVTAVFMSTQGIVLKLPDKNRQPRVLTPGEIVLVELLPDGLYKINGETVDQKSNLSEYISAGASVLPQPVMVLQLNYDAPYQEVIDVLELSKTAGVSTFSIQYMEGSPKGLKVRDDK